MCVLHTHTHTLRIQPFLTNIITFITTLVQTMVISCLDHCDSLLMGLPCPQHPAWSPGRAKKLRPKSDHITPLLPLHWESKTSNSLSGPPSQSTVLSLASPFGALALVLLQFHYSHKTSLLFLKSTRQVLWKLPVESFSRWDLLSGEELFQPRSGPLPRTAVPNYCRHSIIKAWAPHPNSG